MILLQQTWFQEQQVRKQLQQLHLNRQPRLTQQQERE
jgi:hypothetical protein